MVGILIRPIITEKMTELGDKRQYAFEVPAAVNKIEVGKAVEKKFNVHVVTVRTINHPGKMKTQFRKNGRFTGKTAKSKKAVITLKKGETIELFEQV